MTKRHFEAIAAVLEAFSDRMDPQDHWELTEAIGDVCQWTNSRFDRQRFRTACGQDAWNRPKSLSLRSA